MKLLTIVGTRPQFIKAAALSKLFVGAGIQEILVHTGQHYDPSMSEVFFKGLGMKVPDYQFERPEGCLVGRIMVSLEEVVHKENPDGILVFGDCDTTLAGGLVANKIGVPLIHLEAGCRSGDMQMPEEVNRKLTDHISDLLVCPEKGSLKNLEREGIELAKARVGGDLMVDLLRSLDPERFICDLGFDFESKDFILLTLHRKSNVQVDRLTFLLEEFSKSGLSFLWPIHPRTRKFIEENSLVLPPNLHLLEPVGFPEMMGLVRKSRAVFTDSGGLQKEAYELRRPCFILRSTTEWTSLCETGRNRLLPGEFPPNVSEEIERMQTLDHPQIFLDGAAPKTVQFIVEFLS